MSNPNQIIRPVDRKFFEQFGLGQNKKPLDIPLNIPIIKPAPKPPRP